MKFKSNHKIPEYVTTGNELPRNQSERLAWIKKRVEDGYYESEKVRMAVADAFIEPSTVRRAGGAQ
ncbi:MAG: hypothetical protein VX294_02565 [Candidatus Latescibacterota bacterium]|nr:hypothetical protein [Candidatus Latescibacterota bacterium]